MVNDSEQGTVNREQGTGNREQGTGNREQGTVCSKLRGKTSAECKVIPESSPVKIITAPTGSETYTTKDISVTFSIDIECLRAKKTWQQIKTHISSVIEQSLFEVS